MGFRSAVTEVAKNIVLGAPSTLKNHRVQNHQRGKNGRDDDEMEPFDFSHEDEAQRCIELLEHLSNAILPEETLEVLNQLRDCVRESRTSQMVAAKVGGVYVIFECLLEEMQERGDVRREGTREDDDGEAANWEGEANGERDESRGAGREERERVQHVANDIFERFLREVSRDADFVRDVEQTKHEEKSARGNRKVARSVGGARE